MSRFGIGLLLLAVTSLPLRGDLSNAEEMREAEQVLQAAGIATDGPTLLDYLRKRTLTARDREKLAELVRQLGDSTFKVREQATAELVGLGPIALPELKKNLNSADLEQRNRAARCVETIERGSTSAATIAVVQVLKQRQPADACSVLLAFLGVVDEEDVEEQVLGALRVVAVRGDQVDAAVISALKDPAPTRRAAAAFVVGSGGSAAQRDQVRTLFQDADAKVRLRAAEGLLQARQRDAIPQLLALLAAKSVDVSNRAEEVFGLLAEDKAPASPSGAAPAAGQRHEAWLQWWKTSGKKLDLAKLDADLLAGTSLFRTRDVARRFLDALVKGDQTTLQRTTDVPFGLTGDQLFQQRSDLTRFLAQIGNELRAKKPTFSPVQVIDVDAYLRTAPKNEPAMLDKLSRSSLRVVYIKSQLPGRSVPDYAAVFVRTKGGQMRVVGIGNGRPTGARASKR